MFILFDIGGTKMRLAASADGNTFGDPLVVRDHGRYADGLSRFAQAAKALAGGEHIHACVGGLAGMLALGNTGIALSENLSDWQGKPFASDISALLGAPVYIENDAACAALGEAHRGAGKGSEIMIYLTVSTGIGGARIVSGALDEHTVGFEPGKQIVDADHTIFPGDEPPTLENYISGRAMERRFGVPPYEIRDEALWREAARLLAFGLHNTLMHWSSDMVVLGGSMMTGEPRIPLARVEEELHRIMPEYPHHPVLSLAELGDHGGLWGGLVLLRQRGLL